jgi:hypothetical protein
VKSPVDQHASGGFSCTLIFSGVLVTGFYTYPELTPYTPSSSIPSGFGVPWDVQTNDLLIKATCTTTSDATLDFGKNSPSQYIYKTAYHYHTSMTNWSPLTLTSAESLVSQSWYPKTATATLSNLDLTNTTHYALGYVCTWNGSKWLCGCRDSACTQSYWQIQSFKR